MSSPSSTEAPPGFAVRSEIGGGPRGTVHVAEQTGLGRDVALKLYEDTAPVGQWPEHPGVARLHAAGVTAHGAFTASQLAPGGSLARRLAEGTITRGEALALCDAAERTLAELDVAHGALGAGNILIGADGGALLCDFGMPGVEPSAAADRAALAALRERCEALPALRERRRHRGWLVAAAGAAVAAVLLAVVLSGGDEDQPAPAPISGAHTLGSRLAGAPPTTLSCDGLPPSGSAPACTIAQLRRGGRPAAFPASGVVRRWAVRGAVGELALQIVRPVAGGRYGLVATAQPVVVDGRGVHAFATDLAVRRGDFAALVLRPQSGVGMRRGTGSVAPRFVGPLNFADPEPQPPSGASLNAALELRIDYVPGGRPRPLPTLTGAAARSAPAGRRIAARQLEFPGAVRTVAVVAANGRVALDLLAGTTRVMRVAVAGADPGGRLDSFDAPTATGTGAAVSWRNPDGRAVIHHYRTSADRLVPVD